MITRVNMEEKAKFEERQRQRQQYQQLQQQLQQLQQQPVPVERPDVTGPQAEAAAQAAAQALAALPETAGFQQVIERLRKSNKPIITHNGFLDVLFTVEQFVDTLPGY